MTSSAAAGRRIAMLAFAILVTAIYGAGVAIVGQLPHLDHRGAVAVGLTLDLVVVVPLAFYLLVVRRGNVPAVTLAPVLVISAIAASRLLPAADQRTLRLLEMAAVPVELALIGWIAWRAARALRAARRDAAADALEQLRRAAFALTRNERVAAVFAFEIAVLYYALGAWRAAPHVPRGATAVTHHVRSGHAGVVLAFLVVMATEGVAMHLLIAQWSVPAAWILTIGTAYGALWLIADYRATVLRPILIGPEDITLRAGLRCTLLLPLSRIAEVGRVRPDLGKESLKLGFVSTPTHWITLSEPMLARGPYGLSRRVRAIGFEPDAPEEFDRAIAAGLARRDARVGAPGSCRGIEEAGTKGAVSATRATHPHPAGVRRSADEGRRRVMLGSLAGGGVLLGVMLMLAVLAAGLGWIARDGAGRVDLGPWLAIQIVGGAVASVAGGAVSRCVARSFRGPALLAVAVAVLGTIEAAEILRHAHAGGVVVDAGLVRLAPVVAAGGVLLGGWRRRTRS